MTPLGPPPHWSDTPAGQAALVAISRAFERIRYGEIRLTLHDGRLVQIDVTERTRLGHP